MNKILVVCGPTASGKTGFATEMAKRLHGEVISADCMLVYRGLDIGTAKPTEQEKQGVPHHMIDVAAPCQNYSVGDYEAEALPIVERLLQEGVCPVLCGGTGFYLQSLLFFRGHGKVGADEKLRRRYEEMAAREGNLAVFERLKQVDAESAEKLHPNDLKRVIRALEIFELTGEKKSAQQDGFIPRFPYVAVAFDYPREELYSRIDRRVDEMLSQGLVEEVRSLVRQGVDRNNQCMQGIGYKEVLEYLDHNISYSTMRDIIQKNTRNYAKRQITFFKKFPNLIWLDPHAKDNEQRVMEAMYAGE